MDAALQPHTPSPTPPPHQARPDDDFGKVYEALSIAGVVGIAGIARESLPMLRLSRLLLLLLGVGF